MIQTMDSASSTPEVTAEDVPTFKMEIGKATYIVGLHFAPQGRENLDTKVRRLILKDVMAQPS